MQQTFRNCMHLFMSVNIINVVFHIFGMYEYRDYCQFVMFAE